MFRLLDRYRLWRQRRRCRAGRAMLVEWLSEPGHSDEETWLMLRRSLLRDGALRRMTPEAKAAYKRIHKLRDETGPIDFEVTKEDSPGGHCESCGKCDTFFGEHGGCHMWTIRTSRLPKWKPSGIPLSRQREDDHDHHQRMP